MSECPLCGGLKRRMIRGTHSMSGAPKMVSEQCLCDKSRIVSMEPATKLLLHLGEEYLDPDRADPKMLFDRDNLPLSPNLLVLGGAEDFGEFCLQIKAVVMVHRFTDPPARIVACRAIDLLRDFYVAQEDGTSPGLSATGALDLLVLALGTKEKNQALATCVAQAVAIRKAVRKPTWLYQPTPMLSQCQQEYSEDLEALVKDFRKVGLTSTGGGRIGGASASRSNMSVANFNPNGGVT